MIAYARALGDARTGNIAGAEAEIGRLQSDNPEHCYGAVQFGLYPQNPCQISSIPHPSLDGFSTLKPIFYTSIY